MTKLPYVTAPGNIDKALGGIKSAAVPERVSQDFVITILNITGGSGRQMTSYLKKIGLASSDGVPTDLYHKFRNPSSSGIAIASCIRKAYAPLYVRNEYAHELSEDDLTGLVIEETGQPHDSSSVKSIVSCIVRLKKFADFGQHGNTEFLEVEKSSDTSMAPLARDTRPQQGAIGLNLGYTINLNLPATSDPAVFDAIFRSLKPNLLSEDNA